MEQSGLGFGDSGRYGVGLDEVGRGPLAGPVVAAAVILPATGLEGMTDSKKLTARRREALATHIREAAVSWGLGHVSADEIDWLDIRRASLEAMVRAVAALTLTPDFAWVDGRDCPVLPCPAEPVVGGDARVPSIAAASILAKQQRDALMIAHAEAYQGYGFERHKGYPTREHLAALDRLGPCALHRRSFAPIRQRLGSNQG